jgi:hypothetical protein
LQGVSIIDPLHLLLAQDGTGQRTMFIVSVKGLK